jgi:hypothetical protein
MKMYPHTFSGQPAVQVESELKSFIAFCQQHNVQSYLEVGVARGDTFHEVMTHLPEGSTGAFVDMPEAQWGLKGSRKDLERVASDLEDKGYLVRSFFGDSKSPDILHAVWYAARWDMVMIDGDHTYEGVKTDFENYAKLGRIVALHDIVDTMHPNRKGEKIEVPKFWQELKAKYKTLEFIGKGSTMGIGIVFMDTPHAHTQP